MKNIVNGSMALLLVFGACLFTSCEEENFDDQEIITDPNPLTQCVEVSNLASWYDDEFPNGYELYPGDECWDSDDQAGTVSENCECVAEPADYDCPNIEANYGDPCETPAVPFGGTVNQDCECEGSSTGFDCPNLQANFGDPCETPAVPFGGTVNQDCECEGSAIDYDCPNLQADIGDACVNVFGIPGVVDANCDCDVQNGGGVDCPGLGGDVGDPCQGGWGIINQDCDCIENNPATICDEVSNLASWYDQEFPNGYILQIGDVCWTSLDEPGTVNENCYCEAD
ncbi:MAG: hypothetical protein AAF487_04240 [Bacteroidota bacterium]